MRNPTPNNLAHSVFQRLLNYAKENGENFNRLLSRYAMERFLYRLSKSEHSEKFILKGALLFLVWEPDYDRRSTKDIDLLGFTENSLDNLAAIAKEVCKADVEEDGIEFDDKNIQVQRIKEDADYEGVRIRSFAFIGRSRIPIQVDIGFGDALVPGAISATVPTLLDFPAPKLRCYHQLTAIAEKFQAMVKLGELNSRMKDFYDIWNIIHHEEIEGEELQKACIATFEQRATPFDLEVRFFSENFSKALGKEDQWAAFVRKQELEDTAPASFRAITSILQSFFRPMVEAQLFDKPFSAKWDTSGQWR
jgi:predicted nucleotidyltransferase component of viral defense system